MTTVIQDFNLFQPSILLLVDLVLVELGGRAFYFLLSLAERKTLQVRLYLYNIYEGFEYKALMNSKWILWHV